MQHGARLATCGSGVNLSFVFEGERASHLQKWTFVRQCVNLQMPGTWCTYDAVTNEAQEEVQHSFVFHRVCQQPPIMIVAVPR